MIPGKMTGTTRTRKSKSEVGQLRGPLNNLIAERMRSLGIETVKEFADRFSIGRSTIYDLVRGRSDGTISSPSLETIARLAEALNVPSHKILYLVNPSSPGADTVHVSQVPVYMAGCVGAGPEQLYELEGVQVFVEADFAAGRDLVAFKVRGTSMEGGKRPIYDGDVVIVDRNVPAEQNQPTVARLVGNGYVVKRLRSENMLDSTNPDYTGKHSIVPAQEIAQMVGRVVRVQSNVF